MDSAGLEDQGVDRLEPLADGIDPVAEAVGGLLVGNRDIDPAQAAGCQAAQGQAQVLGGDPTALAVFLAEGLKDESTGKGTSSAELSTTGVWGVRDPAEATAERGRVMTERFVDAAVRFIERWNEMRPPGTE